jgi:hypothetical protein
MEDEIRIPDWLEQLCIRHNAQLTLRVFSIGGDDAIRCNAEIEYRVHHLTPVHNTPTDAVADLKDRLANSARIESEVWKENE